MPSPTVFMTVNGVPVSLEQVLRHVLLEERSGGLLPDLIERVLLREYASSNGISVTAEELQKAADEMRRDRGLEEAGRTMEWLRAHQQTLESLEQTLEHLLIRNKVMSSIPDQEIEAYYREHRDDLESVALFSIRVAGEAEAAGLRWRVEGGEQFSVVAASASLDETTRPLGGFAGRRRRSQLSPVIADAVFCAEPGAMVGPLRTEKGYNLFLIADRRMPSLEEEGTAIRLLLFEELMAGLRNRAVVRYPIIEGG